jgi:hypothetical protein
VKSRVDMTRKKWTRIRDRPARRNFIERVPKDQTLSEKTRTLRKMK